MQIFNVLHVEFQIFSWLTKVALLGVTLSGLDVLEVLETSLAPIRISNSNSTFSLNTILYLVFLLKNRLYSAITNLQAPV